MTEPRSETSPAKTGNAARYFFLGVGCFFVFLGVLGAFLPLLPTTIFLILASACFMRSSERANRWLKNNRFLGSYLRNYQEKTGMTVASKAVHIAVLWAGISASAYFLADNLPVQILLFVIAAGVTVHLVMVKTAR